MTTEELKLKVSLDTSGLQQDVAKVKTTMKGAEESLSGKGMAKGAQATTESLTQVRDSLENIRNLQFADMIIENFDALKQSAKSAVGWFKVAGEEFGMVFDTRHFIGANNAKETIHSMGLQLKESIISMRAGTKTMYEGLGKAMGGLSATMAQVVVSLGVVLAQVLAIAAATKMAINNAKEIAQVSREAQKIGLSMHAYEEWGYILKQNGVEIDKLSDFLKTLADEQNAVREGSEDIIQAFEKIGISAEDAANMNQSDLFDKTVEGLQGVENSVERTGIAYKIFGEDAAQLMPILSMNSQEIAQLRQNYELLGGAASATLVQRSQQLQSSLGNLGQAWQGVKNAITEALLPAIIAVVNWFTKAIAVIGMFFRAIFGTDTKKATSSTNSMSSGMNSYSTAVDGATKAVQKLKREQMGFDELNVLPGKDESSGSGSGSPAPIPPGGVGMGDMGLPTVEDMGLGKFQEWMDKYKSTIQMVVPIALTALGIFLAVIGGITGNIPLLIAGVGLAGLGIAVGISNGAWERLVKGIKDMWKKLKAWFKTNVAPVFTSKFWKTRWNNLKTAANEKLGEIKQTISKKTKPIRDWFDEKVKPFFTKTYWSEKFSNIKISAREKLNEIKSSFSEKWKAIKDWFNEKVKPFFTKTYWHEKFGKIKVSAREKLNEIKESLVEKWKAIKDWFGEKVKPYFTKTYWHNKFGKIKTSAREKLNEIKESLQEKWKGIKDWFNEKIKPYFTKTYWHDKFGNIKSSAREKLNEVKSSLAEKWKVIKDWFNENVKTKFTKTYWLNKFDTIRSAAKSKIGEVKTAISGKWGEIKKWFNDNVSPKFTKSYWLGKFNSIKDGAKSAFNGVISVVESAVNGIIKKINTLSWKIPDWVPKYGGDRFGFNLSTISIPRLATGGIATRSVLANIGENGKEAVLPLENNTGWMDALADKIASRNSSPSRLYLQVDGKTLGWVAIDNINKITKQTGEIQLAL